MVDTFIEYSILHVYNGGCPFYLHNFKSLEEAKIFLLDLIVENENRNRMYFVDNEYFKNKYQNFVGMKNFRYYKIVCRKVEKWHKIEDLDLSKDNKNNLIYYNFQN